jgi:hypothetical protein
MSNKTEATYHPNGNYTVTDWPESVAAWGRTSEIPPHNDVMESYQSPGTAPWAAPTPTKGLPPWAWVSIILGAIFLMCSAGVVSGIFEKSAPAPSRTVSILSTVTTTGTCQKNIIGRYSLVATVTATNLTNEAKTGQVWVNWPVTGAAPSRFAKTVTLQPGTAVEFPVNQPVSADDWFRTGECTYGFDAS